MKLKEIREELDKICNKTNFSVYGINHNKRDNLEIDLYHDNDCGEDLHHEIEFRYPKTKIDFYSSFKDEVEDVFYNYDIDEEVKLGLEAKANGFGGVPSARELEENCERISDDLREFYYKVSGLYKRICNEEEMG